MWQHVSTVIWHEQCTKANEDNHDQIILNYPFLHGLHKILLLNKINVCMCSMNTKCVCVCVC